MAGLDFGGDPFGHKDPFAAFDSASPFGGAVTPKKAPAPRDQVRVPLSKDEYKSFGQQALDASASGVSAVMGALDKPGQAVRSVLAGKGLVTGLKHLTPFSGAMGLTQDKDFTSGRDLTDSYGITQKNDKGWGAWGKGLATDLATDPLSYMTFGAKSALTPIGQAVSKTGALRGWTGKQMLQGFNGVEGALLAKGKTASDIAHYMDRGARVATGAAEATGVKAKQALGSLVRVGLPFGGPGVNVGTGKTAQKIAGQLDKAGDYLKYGNPIGRSVGSLFDSSRHGATGAMTQRGAVKYMDPALQEGMRQARMDRYDLIKHLDPLVTANPSAERGITDATRAVSEGVGDWMFSPSVVADVKPAASHIRSVYDRMLGRAKAEGAPIADSADKYAKYVHRSAFPEDPASLQMGVGKRPRQNPAGEKMFSATHGANVARDPLYRDIPGGTARMNEWFDRYAGAVNKSNTVAVENAIRKDLVFDFHQGGGIMSPDIAKQFDAKAEAFARRLAVSSPTHRSTIDRAGKPFFSPDTVADFTQRTQQDVRSIARTKAAIGILADNAQRFTPGSGMIPMSHALKQLGLQTQLANRVTGAPMEGAMVNLYRGLAKHGAGKVDPFLHAKPKALKRAINQFGVSPEQLAELTANHAKWQAPEETKSALSVLDSVTNAFKALAYPIWIPSHVRNAVTAGVNNMRHGVGIRDYADQLGVMTGRGARDLSGVHPSLAGLPRDRQIEELRRLQYGAAEIYGGHGMNDEIAGNVAAAHQSGGRYTPNAPGSDRSGKYGNVVADTADLVLNQGLLGSLNGARKAATGSVAGLFDMNRRWGQSIGENLGIKGVGGARKDAFAAVKAGREAGTNVEDFFRGALFNKLSRTGQSPSQAGNAVNALHFDYNALTSFEKNVMRRVMPFFTYFRKNLPLQIDTAIHNPGILQAQSKPFNQKPVDGTGYVPEYLNGGFAIPLGPEKDGQRQYISKLGLPMEEAFDKFHFRNGLPDFRRSALANMGGMNPIFKGPIEQLFNTQFHTQRQLSDLRAPAAASAIGRLFGEDNPQLLSQVMSNSPFTRFVSSADKLIDPRKSFAQKLMNLGTGVKVTDVDVDKQRAIDMRTALVDLMKRQPHISQYTSFYLKPGAREQLSPEEIQAMQAWAAHQKDAKDFKASQKIGIQK